MLISALSTITSPGGSAGNVQFNSAAGTTFSGNSNLFWDTTNNNKLTVVGNISSTTFSSSVTNAVGYFLKTIVEYIHGAILNDVFYG